MSTQINTYVMWGVLLPYNVEDTDEAYAPFEEYQDSAFDGEFNPKDGLTVLFGSMDGSYIALGHVVAKSRDGEGLDEIVKLGDPPTCNICKMHELIALLGEKPEECNPGWLVISHYR